MGKQRAPERPIYLHEIKIPPEWKHFDPGGFEPGANQFTLDGESGTIMVASYGDRYLGRGQPRGSTELQIIGPVPRSLAKQIAELRAEAER